jgi:3-phenylpropionate/trans-cinnamate dioxygenase ferredoxin reductase subunit
MEQSAVTVSAVRDVGPDAIALELETPAGFSARPGQFVKLVTTVDGEEASRFYTISSPDVEETFELTVGIDPDGDVSPHLVDLERGDEVTLSGPYGNAYYEDDPSVLIIAGGPGIGPAVGIAERAIADGGEAAVVYRDADVLHEDRLDALAESGVPVRVLDEDDDLTADVADVLTDDQQVFVYGFADFLDAAIDAIEAAGGSPDAAKVENFG